MQLWIKGQIYFYFFVFKVLAVYALCCNKDVQLATTVSVAHFKNDNKLCLVNRNINNLFPSSICHFVVYILMNVKYMQRYQHINIFASISGPEVSDVIMLYAYFTITESLKWIENQAGGKQCSFFIVWLRVPFIMCESADC